MNAKLWKSKSGVHWIISLLSTKMQYVRVDSNTYTYTRDTYIFAGRCIRFRWESIWNTKRSKNSGVCICISFRYNQHVKLFALRLYFLHLKGKLLSSSEFNSNNMVNILFIHVCIVHRLAKLVSLYLQSCYPVSSIMFYHISKSAAPFKIVTDNTNRIFGECK